jgi:hypothetical protein
MKKPCKSWTYKALRSRGEPHESSLYTSGSHIWFLAAEVDVVCLAVAARPA